MRLILAILCCAAISGCATIRDTFFPVATPCAPKDSPSPPKTTPNALLAKFDDYHMVLVIAAERNDLIDYAGKASAIIEACR